MEGSITPMISMGVQPYSFLWSDNSTDSVLVNLSAGMYSLTVTDAIGQSIILSEEITEPSAIQIDLVTTIPEFDGMMDGIIEINSFGGTPGFTYSWSHDNGLNSTIASNLSTGDYEVTVTDANGCMSLLQIFLDFSSNTNNQEFDNAIKIHPNPVVNGLKIEVDGVESIDEIQLINTLGTLLNSWKSFRSGSWIELINIPSGNYFLLVRSEERTVSKKIIVK